MSHLKVLVVDDSLVAAQLLKQALETLGHTVPMIAKTGAEALSAFGVCQPDLVTMDITMPGISGIEAAAQLMKAYPHAKVLMVTSHAQERMITDAMEAGAKGYILKPVKVDKLHASIQRAMASGATAAA